jgi:hypothetical protein
MMERLCGSIKMEVTEWHPDVLQRIMDEARARWRRAQFLYGVSWRAMLVASR